MLTTRRRLQARPLYAERPSPPLPYALPADESPSDSWVDGAGNILRSYEMLAIQLVCQFCNFLKQKRRGEIVCTRRPPCWELFFCQSVRRQLWTLVHLDVDWKVEGILKQLPPSFPSMDPLELDVMNDILHETDASFVALEFKKARCWAFKRIAFRGGTGRPFREFFRQDSRLHSNETIDGNCNDLIHFIYRNRWHFLHDADAIPQLEHESILCELGIETACHCGCKFSMCIS